MLTRTAVKEFSRNMCNESSIKFWRQYQFILHLLLSWRCFAWMH